MRAERSRRGDELGGEETVEVRPSRTTSVSVRSFPWSQRVLIAVLVVGLAAFVVVHSFVLVRSGGEQTHALARTVWLAGLALVAAALAYASLTDS